MLSTLDSVIWFMSLVCVIGSVLNVKKMSMSFVLWTISNIFWLAYDIYFKAYARSILDLVNLATSTWGIITWVRDERSGKDRNTK